MKKSGFKQFVPKWHDVLVLGLGASLLSSAGLVLAANNKDAWVLSYEGKSTEAFMLDKRAPGLIRATLPKRLANGVLDGMGGPPDPVRVVENRYLSVSGCVAHACMMKGFYWIDAQSGAALGVAAVDNTLLVGSKDLSAASLPAQARQTLRAWLSDNDIEPGKLEFMNAAGATAPLARSELGQTREFRPPPQGPSFDCRRAKTRIELTICNDPGLSKQDLELAAEVRQLRHGHSTVSDQDAVRAFQRVWLKRRDAACAGSAQVADCIAQQYTQQYHQLRKWLPPR